MGSAIATGALALNGGANQVNVTVNGATLGSVTAGGGTAALTMTGVSTTMSAATYNLFNTTGITAAGTETITLNSTLGGAATLNANVENFVLAGGDDVTLGAAGQSVSMGTTGGTIRTGTLTTVSGTFNGGAGTDILQVDTSANISAATGLTAVAVGPD